MNSYEKYHQEKEHKEYWEKKQEQVYYLQRKLRAKNIKYNSRDKIVFPTSDFAEDKHVKKLLIFHNYTVQTIIE